MLPILGVPFLEHQLRYLRGHGVDSVTFACGFLPDAIVDYFGDGARVDMRLYYAIEPEPLDTAGAIGFAAHEAGVAERFLVVNGDVLTDIDLSALISFHDAAGAEGTIALTKVDDPSQFGVVPTLDIDPAGERGLRPLGRAGH